MLTTFAPTAASETSRCAETLAKAMDAACAGVSGRLAAAIASERQSLGGTRSVAYTCSNCYRRWKRRRRRRADTDLAAGRPVGAASR